MQKWAKRGLQTALVTGGLLMLGTGIASAEEDVNPDRPVSPLDGSLTVPVDISNNAIGTIDGGQHDAPEHSEVYSSREITDPIKEGFEDALPEDSDPFRGNRINADVVVPVQIANNAVGLLGDAEVSGGDAQQSYDGSSNIETDGTAGALAGNVIDLDWALPVQIANNAAAAGGTASSTDNNADQDTTQGGSVDTDGNGGVLSGNIIAPDGATPVLLNNNGAAVAGTADSSDNSSSSGTNTGGSLATDAEGGVLSGNIVGAPVAYPVEVANNAASWGGIADSTGNTNSADATAGGTRVGMNDIDTYATTNGNDSVLSGNIAQPQVAGDAAVHGVAATWGGIATTEGNSNDTTTKAGAFSNTWGEDSVGGGNMADAPVALPVEAFCIAGSWIGKASATDCENTTQSQAGSGTFTSGEGGTVGGNSVHAPVASTVEAFGIGGTWIGSADAEGHEDKNVKAGGYNGTRGDDSTVSGNVVQAPVAAPVEAFGIGGAWIGDGSGSASETKTMTSGGDGVTVDDDGTGSSNIVAAPIAQPVQAFGIGGAWIGSGHGEAEADTTTTAGGDYHASGKAAGLSGNIVQAASAAPVQVFGVGGVWGGTASGLADNTSSTSAGGSSNTDGANGEGSGNIVTAANSLPVQVFGIGASWIGNGTGGAFNTTDSNAGGASTTDGSDGFGGGNVVSAPIAGAGTVFGNAGSFIGQAEGAGVNDVISTAGGSTETSGDSASLSGNVLSAQALPIAQVFGNAASVLANADAAGANSTDVASGGDITTSGVEGSLSGNIFDVPAAAVAQIFGNALTVGGIANAVGDNVTIATVGGSTATAGDESSLSGTNTQLPLGTVVQIFNFSGPILGEATAVASNVIDVNIAGDLAQIDLPIDGAEMSIDSLPSFDGFSMDQFNSMDARSGAPQAGPALQPQPVDLDVQPNVTRPMPAPAAPGLAQPMPAPAAPEAPEAPAEAEALIAELEALIAEAGLPSEVPAEVPAEVTPQVDVDESNFDGLEGVLAGELTEHPMHVQG